jgi:hypothetical protein
VGEAKYTFTPLLENTSTPSVHFYKARKQFSDSSKTSTKYQNAPDRFSLTLELQQRIATTPPSPIATSPASLAGGRPQQQQRTSPATGSQHQQPFTSPHLSALRVASSPTPRRSAPPPDSHPALTQQLMIARPKHKQIAQHL